ncbi:hypothetical protein B296_00012169 [Ensete ventricosum]|uniref:Uncharacterized protein n=1 Tax=Ensete ventricosum TaxID=4639 RepID=A0A427ANR8_ENSVE|nr:hypothetical protein B296_00012169 [Ensete ventricosum]
MSRSNEAETGKMNASGLRVRVLERSIDRSNGRSFPSPLSSPPSYVWELFIDLFFSIYFNRCYCLQALPNQQTVDYPSFKLVLVGDGGTGEMSSYLFSRLAL